MRPELHNLSGSKMGTKERDRAEEEFLDKLRCIVIENLHNDQFGVSTLAGKAGISRSYLHRKLVMIKHQSASKFICEIRLKEACILLVNKGLTASEAAYKVGFNDPSYFSSCFHDYFGFPPGQLKKHLSDMGKGVEDVLLKEVDFHHIENSLQSTSFGQGYSWIYNVIPGILFVLSAFVIIFFTFFSKDQSSIIVLPFKNLSSSVESGYIADAMADQLITRLSSYKGIEVKSPGTLDRAAINNMSDRKIAKKFGVTYILRGSIIPEGEKIRVVVQLISAKTDDHVWGHYFDKDLTGIHSFLSEVSEKISSELMLLLSPDVDNDKLVYCTTTGKANDLYLEGRFFYRLRTKEGFFKSIDLFNQALTLDSNYCLAYAGLADSYLTSTWYGYFTRGEGISKSKEYAYKAISINKDLAEPHTTLGGIAAYFDNDWDMAEKELKKAMQLDPGYVRAVKIYSEYMDLIGNGEEARNFIDKAIELQPTLPILFWHSYYYYYKEGDFDKASEELEKEYLLTNNRVEYLGNLFFLNLLKNNYSAAIELYKEFSNMRFPNENLTFITDDAIKIDSVGIIRQIIELEKQRDASNYWLAQHYALINDNNEALDYLEKGFNNGEGVIARIKYEPAYKNLTNEPRFIALLKKMNFDQI